MLVKHVFPSDGEYTLTVTPIFGDNMSPTGFGSVPCEKLEILLDGERVQLMDWQGSRRLGRARRRTAAVRGSQQRARPRRGARRRGRRPRAAARSPRRNEIPR